MDYRTEIEQVFLIILRKQKAAEFQQTVFFSYKKHLRHYHDIVHVRQNWDAPARVRSSEVQLIEENHPARPKPRRHPPE